MLLLDEVLFFRYKVSVFQLPTRASTRIYKIAIYSDYAGARQNSRLKRCLATSTVQEQARLMQDFRGPMSQKWQ